MITPEDIESFAHKPENHDAFAACLAKILPHYTIFHWGGPPATYKRHFMEWQKGEFSIYPNHYYSPIPDLTKLSDQDIERRSNMKGIKFDTAAMLKLVETFRKKYAAEYAVFNDAPKDESKKKFFFGNSAFGRVDAEILHCMVRHFAPKRFIEIGSGNSSMITAAACELNRAEGRRTVFSLVEPYPNDLFFGAVPGIARLNEKDIRECPLRMFEELEAGDMLFIDSSHVIRCGNDVEYIYFEIIPRLRPGVMIHIHDIFLPRRYPIHWLKEEFIFWNEQYLVEAMLIHNPSYKVLWAGCHVHLQHAGKLKKAFPGYDPNVNCPGSLWIVRQ